MNCNLNSVSDVNIIKLSECFFFDSCRVVYAPRLLWDALSIVVVYGLRHQYSLICWHLLVAEWVSVGIARGYLLDHQGAISGRVRNFSLFQCSGRLWGPPSLLSNGYWGTLYPRVKGLECEADHSPPSSAKGKNGEAMHLLSYTSSWRA
jgi:hypothetical protein